MTYKNETFTEEQVKEILQEGDKIVIRMREFNFFIKQRDSLLREAFNKKHRCLRCKKTKDIQIHHIYSSAPKEIIDNYEDFQKIFWVPLCKTCHMEEHGLEPPEFTEDD